MARSRNARISGIAVDSQSTPFSVGPKVKRRSDDTPFLPIRAPFGKASRPIKTQSRRIYPAAAHLFRRQTTKTTNSHRERRQQQATRSPHAYQSYASFPGRLSPMRGHWRGREAFRKNSEPHHADRYYLTLVQRKSSRFGFRPHDDHAW